MSYHKPVLADEVVSWLRPTKGMLLLDGTLGGGGHTERLLSMGADVIGLDRDADAIAECSKRLSAFGNNLKLVQANYSETNTVLDQLGVATIDGALLDIGVSSHQLDTAERGFSFQQNAPLDMRMNQNETQTAADILNHASLEDLIHIFREYGEERKAARIASQIVTHRTKRPFETTFDLVAAIERVAPRTGPRHPATRVFQALRMAVNQELHHLELGLQAITTRLAPGARFAVITFHSLEDRIVKQFFRTHSAESIDRPEWPAPKPNPERWFVNIHPKPITASPTELAENPRSRSAKLRVVEKI